MPVSSPLMRAVTSGATPAPARRDSPTVVATDASAASREVPRSAADASTQPRALSRELVSATPPSGEPRGAASVVASQPPPSADRDVPSDIRISEIRVTKTAARPEPSPPDASAPGDRDATIPRGRATRSASPESAPVPTTAWPIDRQVREGNVRVAMARRHQHAPPPEAPPQEARPPVRVQMMGIAPAVADRPSSRTDISGLLARPLTRETQVRIDRVAVTVQAPPVVSALASPAPRAAAPPAARTTSMAKTFRNPWASYHARRD